MGEMSDSVGRTTSLETGNPLMKWVDEMRTVVQMIAKLNEENLQSRTAAEAAQREYAKLHEEAERLRTEVRSAGDLAEAARRERDALREEVAALRAENDRVRREQTEAADTAANLVGEMKALVNEVARKFQGPQRPSPFARDSTTPHS
jgi:chromosome segregation ATPase